MRVAVKQLAELFLKGKVEESLTIMEQWIEKEVPSMEVYEELLTETMYHIGELWEENQITVADEHIASNVCKYIASNYVAAKKKSHLDQERLKVKNKAMFFCVDEEKHDLGIQMVSNIFKESNWDVRLLGASLPLEDALSFARKWQPDVIGMSVSIAYHLPSIINYTNELQQLSFKPTILVGGRLARIYNLKEYCTDNTLVFQNLKEVHNWINYIRDDEHGDASSF
ncbi:cobalamin B12-binding domain-containing protein [Metabacillus iocasae]|uniref:Methanogenic corrinoid protein MtbC1 n=1 Tax=Priestia iocasae TaxID=2291674 RepID=A0ABS2QRQ2_9BACI|nr:cobalamin-dependent protein [Metabacillus iocasae]MBM7702122.1 methanogenic corrinoid protein MtbC1 [Metabacillus iocasae]